MVSGWFCEAELRAGVGMETIEKVQTVEHVLRCW